MGGVSVNSLRQQGRLFALSENRHSVNVMLRLHTLFYLRLSAVEMPIERLHGTWHFSKFFFFFQHSFWCSFCVITSNKEEEMIGSGTAWTEALQRSVTTWSRHTKSAPKRHLLFDFLYEVENFKAQTLFHIKSNILFIMKIEMDNSNSTVYTFISGCRNSVHH